MSRSRVHYARGILAAMELLSEAADNAYLASTAPDRPSTQLASERAFHAGLSDALEAVSRLLPAGARIVDP